MVRTPKLIKFRVAKARAERSCAYACLPFARKRTAREAQYFSSQFWVSALQESPRWLPVAAAGELVVVPYLAKATCLRQLDFVAWLLDHPVVVLSELPNSGLHPRQKRLTEVVAVPTHTANTFEAGKLLN